MAEMSLLLQNCVIFDPQSPHHKKNSNILIDKGVIQSVSTKIIGKSTLDLKGTYVSPGWVDMNAHFCDPGLEHKEDIESGVRTAVGGGFTSVCLVPNTHPVTETKSDVEYLLSKSGRSVDILPIAALSEGTKGENMTEMLDLHTVGAVAFSDGLMPIWNSELLLKALQYAQKINGLVISRPKDPNLSKHAQMHEGKASTILGMRGEPSLSEKLQIITQLELLRYAGGRLHFTMISTAEGVRLIKQAKKEGLQVTCDVGVNHLYFTDEDVEGFDTRFKVDPPFRSGKDRKALIAGVNDGTIDAIVSGHQPQDRESKYLEFDLAEPGITSLQTVYSVIHTLSKELDQERAFAALTSGPRRILGLNEVKIEEGMPAVLSVFDPKEQWVMNDKTNLSKSRNSPFWNKTLEGKSRGVINGTKIHLK
jgi:dihydroorotase